jgi:hypothetical protein
MTHYKGKELTISAAGRNTGKSAFSSLAFQRLFDDLHNRPVYDLKLSEGTVYGSRYYTVEPVGGNWAQIEMWCWEHFGHSNSSIWSEKKAPEPAERWYMNNRKFWFRNEADRTMFILKWR